MKKYSNKHLESVPPEYIWAVEKSIEMVKYGNCSRSSCMTIILRCNGRGKYWCIERGKPNMCPEYIGYKNKFGDPCPCSRFGEKKSIAMMENLVKQWKAWAGLVG